MSEGHHVRNKRISDETILESYRRLGNVHRVAAEVGLNHSSVHERLVRLRVARHINHWTAEEDARLRHEYPVYRDAGKVRDLAATFGRSIVALSIRARRRHGLSDARHPKRSAVWKYMTEAAAAGLFGRFKRSRLTLAQFCKRRHLGDEGFSETMRRFFPDEWDAVIEAKVPRQTMYRYGRQFEYRVRDVLRAAGYYVLRSPRSGSPTDLVAVKRGQVLFVQCKRGGDLPRRGWNALRDLADSVDAVPLLARMPDGFRGIEFRRLVGPKGGTKSPQPYVVWTLPAKP
jgi:hypothetical protein